MSQIHWKITSQSHALFSFVANFWTWQSFFFGFKNKPEFENKIECFCKNSRTQIWGENAYHIANHILIFWEYYEILTLVDTYMFNYTNLKSYIYI
jgi:hypothetical protein